MTSIQRTALRPYILNPHLYLNPHLNLLALLVNP